MKSERAAELSFVHRYIPGPSRDTVLALHGTGGNEDDLVPLARELAPSANLLSPRGRVLEQGMPRFFRRLAMGVFDEEDLVGRARDLANFVVDAAKTYAFDATRVFALGYSNGANVAAAVLLLHPSTLAGAALLRPVLPLEPPSPPVLTGKPVLIAAGTHDPYSDRGRVEALVDRLKQGGADVEVHWARRGHELGPDELEKTRRWFAVRGM
jgi:phospholipase/carboxylesterase